jgi:hypothetical protein
MKLELSYKIKSRLVGYDTFGKPQEFFTLYVYKGEKMPNFFQTLFGKSSSPIWDKIEDYSSLDQCKDAVQSNALRRYNSHFYKMNQSLYVPKEYSVWITVENGNVGPVILSDKL